MKYPCPCCGYLTLEKPTRGSYEICPICCWEDDDVQLNDPDYVGGANRVSLRQAQRNFQSFGASDEHTLPYVRKPDEMDQRDPSWKPL